MTIPTHRRESVTIPPESVGFFRDALNYVRDPNTHSSLRQELAASAISLCYDRELAREPPAEITLPAGDAKVAATVLGIYAISHPELAVPVAEIGIAPVLPHEQHGLHLTRVVADHLPFVHLQAA